MNYIMDCPFAVKTKYIIKKVAIIFGTRPEAIKLCPVVLAMKADPRFDCKVCVTGQHRELLQQVLDVFGVVPDKDLALMRPNQTLGGLTSRAIAAIGFCYPSRRNVAYNGGWRQ